MSGAGDSAEVYALRPDGTDRRRLTHNAAWDADPDWSPDGRRIAFVSSRDSARSPAPGVPGLVRGSGIYLMNADGSGVRRLTETAGDAHPRWSPDGRQIAFSRLDTTTGATRVYVMNADGSGARPLTASPTTSPGDKFAPEWSPDGRYVLFLSNRPPRVWWTVYRVRADGSDEQPLGGDATCFANVRDARWSPDGTRIAYTCENSGPGLYLMRPDGSGVVRLSAPNAPGTSSYDSGPVWSPDGRQLAFARTRVEGTLVRVQTTAVYVMGRDGDAATRVMSEGAESTVAAWSRP